MLLGIILILFIILMIILFMKNRKRKEGYGDTQTITNCILINRLINNLRTQLNNAFVPSNLVGPITLTIGPKSITFPKITDFTQSFPGTDKLPSFVSTSPIISIFNQKSTWDSIFFGDNAGSTNPFQLFLNHSIEEVVWNKGVPVCANGFVRIINFVLDDMILKNFGSTINISSITPAECKPINNTTRGVSYPFYLNVNPDGLIHLTSYIEVYSGNCRYGPKCNNPLKSCFYDWHCYDDINKPCHNAAAKISSSHIDGHVKIHSDIKINNTIVFDFVKETNGNTYIENISINYKDFEINSTSDADINLTGFAGKLFGWLGGKDKVEKTINGFLSDFVDKSIPNIFTALNNALKGQKILL